MTIGSASGLLVLTFMAACGENREVPPPPSQPSPVRRDPALSMSPATVRVTIGDTVRLTPRGDGFETAIKLIWRSTDPAVANVDQAGLLTARSRGGTEVSARSAEDSTLAVRTQIEVR